MTYLEAFTAIKKCEGINNIKIIEIVGRSFTAYQFWGTDFALDRAKEILLDAGWTIEAGETPVGKFLVVRVYKRGLQSWPEEKLS